MYLACKGIGVGTKRRCHGTHGAARPSSSSGTVDMVVSPQGGPSSRSRPTRLGAIEDTPVVSRAWMVIISPQRGGAGTMNRQEGACCAASLSSSDGGFYRCATRRDETRQDKTRQGERDEEGCVKLRLKRQAEWRRRKQVWRVRKGVAGVISCRRESEADRER